MSGINVCPFKPFCKRRGDFCIKCRDDGIYYVASKAHLPRTNIPRIYYKYDIRNLDPVPILLSYYEDIYSRVNEGESVYLFSKTPGTGKTSIGCSCLFRYLGLYILNNPTEIDSLVVYYLNVSEYMEELRSNMNRAPNDERRLKLEGIQDTLFDVGRAPKLLLMDDIGNEKPSDWVRERLYNLINFRVANGLSNIYTSNVACFDIAYLGQRIISRLNEATQIFVPGRDMRRNIE